MANEIADPIVDRLKAEGQLTRNTGTNSIRSVKIQLDRFESIFNVISENITAQTEMMAKSLDMELDRFKISQETAEREKAKEQIEELEANQKDNKKSESEESKDKKGLFDLIQDRGGVGSILGNLLKGSLLGGGLFVLGNFFKGFIDTKIGESEFTKGLVSAFTWGAVGTIFGKKFGLLLATGNILSNVFNLPEVIEQIGAGFDSEFTNNPLISQGIGTALGAALTVAWLKGGLRTKIIGGLIVATQLLGDDLKDWLTSEADVDPDWANTAVDVGTLAIQGALIGGQLGGLPGAIAGALAGLAIGLGGKLIDWIRERKEGATKKFNEDVASIEPILEKALTGEKLTGDELKKLSSIRAEAQRRANLALPQEQVELAKTVDETITGALDQQPIDERGITEGQSRNRAERALEGDTAALEEMLEFARQRERVSAGSLRRKLGFFGGEDQNEFIRVFMKGFVNDLSFDKIEPGDRERFERIIEEFLSSKGFRTGTRGFQDFGDGTFSILHGREAVVPQETAAGRFLEQFFNEDWTPKISQVNNMTERVATATAGGTFNMPVIINNSPVNAPTINNVQGAPSLSSVNYFGGGGGGSQSGIYGLPRAMN